MLNDYQNPQSQLATSDAMPTLTQAQTEAIAYIVGASESEV